MRINSKLLVAELTMLIASVFIFRSLWLLIDMVSFMHRGLALLISLGIAIAVTIPALRYIIRRC